MMATYKKMTPIFVDVIDIVSLFHTKQAPNHLLPLEYLVFC